jgi:hypothetical protein
VNRTSGCYARAGDGKIEREVTMIQTLEAITDEQGRIRLREPVRLPAGKRVLVTILEEPATDFGGETAHMSEPALARDWNRPEEDDAWSHLQPRL